jgi:hypothetical protein
MSPPASTWTVYRQPPQATAPLWASRRHDGRPRIVEKWKRDLQHLREMTLRSSLIIMRCMNNMSICTGLHKSVSFFALLVSVALGFSELEAATPGPPLLSLLSVSSAISLPKSAGEPGRWTRQNEQAAVWPLRESTDHTLDFSSGMHRCRNEPNSNGRCQCLYLSHISHQARPSGL